MKVAKKIKNHTSPLEAAKRLHAPLTVPPPEKSQKLITPNCPRCGAVVWATPCDICHPRVHHWCESCQVEFIYCESMREWTRFDAAGRVIEIIPQRVVGVLPGAAGGEYFTMGNYHRHFEGRKTRVKV